MHQGTPLPEATRTSYRAAPPSHTGGGVTLIVQLSTRQHKLQGCSSQSHWRGGNTHCPIVYQATQATGLLLPVTVEGGGGGGGGEGVTLIVKLSTRQHKLQGCSSQSQWKGGGGGGGNTHCPFVYQGTPTGYRAAAPSHSGGGGGGVKLMVQLTTRQHKLHGCCSQSHWRGGGVTLIVQLSTREHLCQKQHKLQGCSSQSQ